jgi:hypothetical protein
VYRSPAGTSATNRDVTRYCVRFSAATSGDTPAAGASSPSSETTSVTSGAAFHSAMLFTTGTDGRSQNPPPPPAGGPHSIVTPSRAVSGTPSIRQFTNRCVTATCRDAFSTFNVVYTYAAADPSTAHAGSGHA